MIYFALVISIAALALAYYNARKVEKNDRNICRCLEMDYKVIEKCLRNDKRYMDILGRMDGVEKRRDMFEDTVRSALNHYEEEIHSLLDKEAEE